MKKFKVFCNGHLMETAKTLEEAQRIVEREQRRDKYEIEVEGYANKFPVYEIKQ